MKSASHPVILIAAGEYDNLGVGYLSSTLTEQGYESRVVDFRFGKYEILANLKRRDPLVVGFSVIFEGYIDEFVELIRFLRRGGIVCHFTAGGYFASMRPEELFRLVPEIDSIVRYDGEETLSELVRSLSTGTEWRDILGIAFKENNRVVKTPLRHLQNDLDSIPYPSRPPLAEYAFSRKFATIIAGRGCLHDCSFCNNRAFYSNPPGPLKRIRQPDLIVGEMEWLFNEKNCSIFLFQDDDFPVKTTNGNRWIRDFCAALEHRNLNRKIIWKINCRPDEIEEKTFAAMKNHGLFLVFVGLEDGTDAGLMRLNKHMTVSESIKGIEILKRLGIAFDYGFMLFQPSTTFRSLRENLKFLRKICIDGYTPLSFLKLMPYFETRVERELREQGRLRGKPGYLDYEFPEEQLNQFYDFVNMCFTKWLIAPDGLLNISRWARNYFAVYDLFYSPDSKTALLSSRFRNIKSDSNKYILDIMEESLTMFETGHYNGNRKNKLAAIRLETFREHDIYIKKVKSCIEALNLVAWSSQKLS